MKDIEKKSDNVRKIDDKKKISGLIRDITFLGIGILIGAILGVVFATFVKKFLYTLVTVLVIILFIVVVFNIMKNRKVGVDE